MQSDGTNWTAVPGGWVTTKVSSVYTNTTNTLSDIGGLSFNAAAGQMYEIEAWLDITCSGTGGVEFAVKTTGTTPTVAAVFTGNSTATLATSAGSTASGTAEGSPFANASGADCLVRVWAIVKSVGAGTVTLQAKSVTNGQTSTVKVGSKMQYRVQ